MAVYEKAGQKSKQSACDSECLFPFEFETFNVIDDALAIWL